MIKNRWKDKWFYYKLIGAIFALGVVAWIYIYSMVLRRYIGIENFEVKFSFIAFQGQFLSYFTIQTNIIVGVWFLLAAIYHDGHETKQYYLQKTLIPITTYISVTFLTYMLIILPSKASSMTALIWFESLSQHFIIPLLMIFYAMFHFTAQHINVRHYFKKELPKNLIYPGLYFILIIYRAALVYAENKALDASFPYPPPFFAAMRNWTPAGIISFLIIYLIVFSLAVLILLVSVNMLYVYLSNLIYKRKQVKQK